MSVLGDLERLIDDLYPYRWLLALAAALALAALVAVGHRRGWHRTIRRHPRATILFTAVALAVLIPVGAYTLSPLFTRTELNETDPLAVAAAGRVTQTGQFVGADEFHFGRGQVRLIETAPGRFSLRFEQFSVRNGPDLFVYLSPSADGYAADALTLGELKATDGAFNYDIPTGTDLAPFRSVVVWCRQFSVLFATAPLAAT